MHSELKMVFISPGKWGEKWMADFPYVCSSGGDDNSVPEVQPYCFFTPITQAPMPEAKYSHCCISPADPFCVTTVLLIVHAQLSLTLTYTIWTLTLSACGHIQSEVWCFDCTVSLFTLDCSLLLPLFISHYIHLFILLSPLQHCADKDFWVLAVSFGLKSISWSQLGC